MHLQFYTLYIYDVPVSVHLLYTPVHTHTHTHTHTLTVPPAPVTSLMVSNVGERVVTLSWTIGFNGFSPIIGVVADVIPERGSAMTDVLLGNDSMKNITGLMPFRNHIFSVAVVNMIGASDRRTISAFTLSLSMSASMINCRCQCMSHTLMVAYYHLLVRTCCIPLSLSLSLVLIWRIGHDSPSPPTTFSSSP